jgi:hypothetical protein
MDQSGTKKEEVSRTYQGVDGYTPVAAYVGNGGWIWGMIRQWQKYSLFCRSDWWCSRALYQDNLGES